MTWDWQVFLTDDGSGRTYLEWMFEAWRWTLAVAGSSWLVAMVVGAVVGTLRTLPGRPVVSALANAWVELFRNIPLLVQIFLWYFVVPKIFPAFQQVPGFLLVVFALGFFTSARIAEQFRAGIQALPKGQRYAAMAMGFTTAQSYRYVILPMAFRIILPPLTSESMNLLKNSSVAFAVSIAELTMFAMQAQEETSRGIEIYLAVTALYALSAFAVNRVFAVIEKKMRVPGFIVSAGTGGHCHVRTLFFFLRPPALAQDCLAGLAVQHSVDHCGDHWGRDFWHLAGADAFVGYQSARNARHGLCQRHALGATGHGDLVVLLADALCDRATDWRRVVGRHHLCGF